MSNLNRGKVISIINEKGGAGKTNTTIQTALVLGSLGRKVLVIDNDSSFDATTTLTGGNIPEEITEIFKPKGVANTFNLYMKDMPLEPIKVRENVDLFGSTERLVTINGEDAIFSFVDSIDLLASKYDFILIDCPPVLGTQSSAALKASDGLLIPCLPDMYSLKGAVTILTRVKTAQKREKRAPHVIGVFVNRLKNPMPNSMKEIVELMKAEFGPLFMMSEDGPLALSETVKQTEAMALGQSITEYSPNSKAAEEFLSLLNEVLTRTINLESLTKEYCEFTDKLGRAY